MEYKTDRDYALDCDKNDPLKAFRDLFYIPKFKGKDCHYFTD